MKHKRRQKLVKPAFQWRTISVFLSLACVGVLLEATLLNFGLSDVAAQLPNDGEALLERIPRVVVFWTLIAAATLVPFMAAVGILVTFRIAGPIAGFEKYLLQLLGGEQPGPCRIRKGDEFQELCELLNTYVEQRQALSAPAQPGAGSAAGPPGAAEDPAALVKLAHEAREQRVA